MPSKKAPSKKAPEVSKRTETTNLDQDLSFDDDNDDDDDSEASIYEAKPAAKPRGKNLNSLEMKQQKRVVESGRMVNKKRKASSGDDDDDESVDLRRKVKRIKSSAKTKKSNPSTPPPPENDRAAHKSVTFAKDVEGGESPDKCDKSGGKRGGSAACNGKGGKIL